MLLSLLTFRTLKRGDQIAVEGGQGGIEYYHHGIFLGHEKGVADFGGRDKSDAKPRIVDLLQFTDYGKRRLVRINYINGQCLPSEVAADNAEKLVANPSRWGVYDLINNNCEHFAMKCKTGIAISNQVINKLRECLMNPLMAIKYAVASSCLSSGGSLGSLRN